jgi:hypothetical protein
MISLLQMLNPAKSRQLIPIPSVRSPLGGVMKAFRILIGDLHYGHDDWVNCIEDARVPSSIEVLSDHCLREC